MIDLQGLETPKRALDLGCGSGAWILDVADDWPDCQFVGFDILPVQVNLSTVRPDLSNRVQWVRGNFLTGRLPFPRASFDHVHIKSIACAVPEDKWDHIFEEVNRVLKVGGVLEMIEEDLLFPLIKPKPAKRNAARNPVNMASPSSTTPIPPAALPSAQTPHLSSTRAAQAGLLPELPTFSPLDKHAQLYALASHPPSGALADNSTTAPLVVKILQPAHGGQVPPLLQSPVRFRKHSETKETFPSASSSSLSSHSFHSTQNSSQEGGPSSLPSSFYFLSPPEQRRHKDPSGPPVQVITATPPTRSPSQDCALLETLFYGMYDRRFINTRPTSILPNLLNIHFRRCQVSPPVHRYLPNRALPKHEKKPKRREERTTMAAPPSSKPRLGPLQSRNAVSIPAPLPTRPPSSMEGDVITSGPVLHKGLEVCDTDPGSVISHGLGASRPSPQGKRPVSVNSATWAPLHLHRVLSGILSCREAMWEELMTQRGWTIEDFGKPGLANDIIREREHFDSLMERYRAAVQARASLHEEIEAKLYWNEPNTQVRLTKVQREALGEASSENDDDDVESEEIEKDDDHDYESDDEKKHGQLVRRIQVFLGIKDSDTQDTGALKVLPVGG